MSDKKRRRISSTQELTQVQERPVNAGEEKTTNTYTEAENPFGEFYKEDGEFNWDAYQATCPTVYKHPNPHVKTERGDKVYSRESYAQEFYDILTHHSATIKPMIEVGEIHEGIIHGVDSLHITVDVGYRELVYVKYEKETDDVKLLKPGDETAVLITDKKGLVSGSISGGVKQKTFTDLREGIEEGNTAWVGTVKNMIENGGYTVAVQGINCFMPGSLAGINKLSDFSSIIGEELYVVPVSFSPERGTIVVSHRKYLQALIPSTIAELREDITSEKQGKVTGTAKYGVFVEFNKCLTGMIHVNDLDEATLVKFKAREISPGDDITFKVKDIISNTKITLTQKDVVDDSPWADITQRYQIPSTVTAKVKSKKDYGMFITIEEGVTGLLHVSEITKEVMATFSPGDDITVQITRIDVDAGKVFLKIPQ